MSNLNAPTVVVHFRSKHGGTILENFRNKLELLYSKFHKSGIYVCFRNYNILVQLFVVRIFVQILKLKVFVQFVTAHADMEIQSVSKM